MRKNVKHCKFRIILFIEICYFNYNKIFFVLDYCAKEQITQGINGKENIMRIDLAEKV